jgi:hypothetical protein
MWQGFTCGYCVIMLEKKDEWKEREKTAQIVKVAQDRKGLGTPKDGGISAREYAEHAQPRGKAFQFHPTKNPQKSAQGIQGLEEYPVPANRAGQHTGDDEKW